MKKGRPFIEVTQSDEEIEKDVDDTRREIAQLKKDQAWKRQQMERIEVAIAERWSLIDYLQRLQDYRRAKDDSRRGDGTVVQT